MELPGAFTLMIGWFGLFLLTVHAAGAQTSRDLLLVLEKHGTQLAMIDPASLKVVAVAPAGPDPHEVIASADGKVAYISNYGGAQSTLHMISVVDLVERRARPAIDLGALYGTHGLDFAGGELYFTAETNKVIGRYDPSTQKVDWVLGTGQDRTHMVWVAPGTDRIVTSNVSSGTISIIRLVSPTAGGLAPPAGANQKSWEVTNVAVGRGSEGFDVSPDGKEIWAANAQDGTVSIIDFAANKVIQTVAISVKGANRLKFTPDGALVLISGLGSGGSGRASSAPNLVVLDAASRKEVRQFQLGGGAAGILMDPSGSRAFVAVSGGNRVVVVNLKSLTVTGEIAPMGEPDGMAWAMQK